MRLIPAYAGSTLLSAWGACNHEAHPRLRGEHIFHRRGLMVNEGSSPLTRGALFHEPRRFLAVWLIPAYAGSTSRSVWKSL